MIKLSINDTIKNIELHGVSPEISGWDFEKYFNDFAYVCSKAEHFIINGHDVITSTPLDIIRSLSMLDDFLLTVQDSHLFVESGDMHVQGLQSRVLDYIQKEFKRQNPSQYALNDKVIVEFFRNFFSSDEVLDTLVKQGFHKDIANIIIEFGWGDVFEFPFMLTIAHDLATKAVNEYRHMLYHTPEFFRYTDPTIPQLPNTPVENEYVGFF